MLEQKPTATIGQCRAVAGRGRMTPDGYEPENGAWIDVLCDRSGYHFIGRDPMGIDTDILTAAGHPPRRTHAIVSAMGDVPLVPGLVRRKDLRRQCIECAEHSGEVRRCGIINCPIWPYRMGRNPHDPRRGINPFKDAVSRGEACLHVGLDRDEGFGRVTLAESGDAAKIDASAGEKT